VTGTPGGCGVGPTIWAPQIVGQHKNPIITGPQKTGNRARVLTRNSPNKGPG
jgi:hypothetical protein